MNGLSVIIPSKSIANLVPCITYIRQWNPAVRIITINDGLEFGNSEIEVFCRGALKEMVAGAQPFVFARNMNLGIVQAGDDDVILLNDDALLETAGGFTALQRAAQEHPEFGIISSSCNNVGNPNQHMLRGGRLREDPRMVCFVCVLIPRATINLVGMLDERYTGYGMDDDDYCVRIRQAGLKIGIFDGCFVDHSKLKSSYRNGGGGDFRPNLKLFIEKWGVDNWGKTRETSQFPECWPQMHADSRG